MSISSSDLARTTQGGSASNPEVGMCMTMLDQILYFYKLKKKPFKHVVILIRADDLVNFVIE